MKKIARICHNLEGWRHPAKKNKSEAKYTFNSRFGFGFEEWLFRNEWILGGWRYAFIQGVNKRHARLVREQATFDVMLFTIEQPERRRRYVAEICAVECLNGEQAELAWQEYCKRGWADLMRREIEAAGGDPRPMDTTEWAKHILNVRFRLDKVQKYDDNIYASPDDPINHITRYSIADVGGLQERAREKASQVGSELAPEAIPYYLGGRPPVECSPEHKRMQAKLMEQLRTEHPQARVVCEAEYVDVVVSSETELILFEIKSDLEPRNVIRHALGQILEYAYHPSRTHSRIPKLVIVGRKALTSDDEAYMNTLTNNFGLPLSYRVVEI